MLNLDLNLFEKYLTLKQLSPRTIKEYLYYGLRYQQVGGFNNEAVTRFLIDKSNRNNVARAFIIILKKFLLHYREELGISEEDYNIILRTEIPQISGRKKTKLIIPLVKWEIELLEKTLETEHDRLMLLICYNGGLRLQELVGIKVNSFNWEALKESPDEMGEVRVYGKGGKEGICLLPNHLIRRIAHYIKNNSFKEGSESQLFKRGNRYFQQRLRQAGIIAGLTKKDNDGVYIANTIVHPHRLRHSYAHNLLKKGVDIRYIKEALRHTSISSTQIYTQINKDELKEKLSSV